MERAGKMVLICREDRKGVANMSGVKGRECQHVQNKGQEVLICKEGKEGDVNMQEGLGKGCQHLRMSVNTYIEI